MLKMSGENVEQVAYKIEECGGLDKIEQLQGHEKMEIYKMAYDIIEQYFAGDVCIAYSLLLYFPGTLNRITYVLHCDIYPHKVGVFLIILRLGQNILLLIIMYC